MEEMNTLVENQYHLSGLYEDIVKRLGEQEIQVDKVSRKHLAGVDEFHVRGAEVSQELASEVKLENTMVLDVGCGIGGPSRMLADDYNCRVTGIDLSHEFIRTARALSQLVGLGSKTKFIQASALDLPFEDRSFDVAWTQHVQMNIREKREFYSEIERVLTSRGTFIYYDIFRKNWDEVDYPMPWADDPSVSFLETTSKMDKMLQELCFEKVLISDQTNRGMEFLEGLFENLKKNGPSKLGLNVLMGSSTKEKLINLLKGLKEGKLELQSGIYKKQGWPKSRPV
jgi:ubiquinone/menaquinone biosynthesis C-methylase UbiE